MHINSTNNKLELLQHDVDSREDEVSVEEPVAFGAVTEGLNDDGETGAGHTLSAEEVTWGGWWKGGVCD